MKLIKKGLWIIGIIIIGLLVICGTVENGILPTLLVLAIILAIVKKGKFKNFTTFLILFSLITKLIVVFVIQTPLDSDFALMYQTAQDILQFGLAVPKASYYNLWGYQIFHVLYETLILSICNTTIILKILNCIYATIITLLIYKITRKLTNEKAARITSLLYCCTLYPLYLNTILGNQQLALLLSLLGVYLLLNKKLSFKKLILIGLLLGLGHLERNEGIIYLGTVVIYLIITSKNTKELLKNTLPIMITFLIITNGASLLVKSLNINEIGLKNNNPEWKFLLGFNYNTNGIYDSNDTIYLSDKDMLHDEVVARFTNFKKWPNLFYNKIKIQFLYDDFGKSFGDINDNKLASYKNIIFNYTKMFNLFIVVLALIGFIKEGKEAKDGYFFVINLLLFFASYMLIEISARYYYNAEVTMFILSALGINYLLKTADKFKSLR